MRGTNGLRQVPWVSQHFDGEAWLRATPMPSEGPQWWGHRSCGLACVRAALLFHELSAPPLAELLVRALDLGIYTPRGWLHQGLVDLAAEHGLQGSAAHYDEPDDLRALALLGFPSIVSSTHKLPQDGRRGGHLVVFAGESGEGQERKAYFMCPSRWGRAVRSVPSKRFWSSWTGRAVVLRPRTRGGANA